MFSGKDPYPCSSVSSSSVYGVRSVHGGGDGEGKSVAEPLLFLVSLFVEVAGYVTFPEVVALAVAEFTVLAFEMMMVLMLAKGLLVLGERDKI